MSSTPTSSAKKPARWIMIGSLVLVILCCCMLISGALIYGVSQYLGSDILNYFSPATQHSSPWGDAMVLIAAGNGFSAYLTNLDMHTFIMPAGSYYAEIKTANGDLWSCAQLTALDEGNGYGHVDFYSQVCKPLSANSQEIENLVQFLISVDQVRLTYLDIVSNNFQDPLFTSTLSDGWAEEEMLMLALKNLGDQSKITEAAQNFVNRSGFSQTPTKSISGFASPSPNPITKIGSFFGILNEEAEQARQDILSVYPSMSYEEKQEAYEVLPPELKITNINFDEFIQSIEHNEISGLTYIRKELFNSGPYTGIWQTLNPNSNRPSGEIIHRVGAKSLQRGAELYVEVGKGLLSAQFAGIDTGFGYFEKANKWAEYVRGMYVDPKGTLTSEARNQVESALSDYIKSAIQAQFPDLGETLAEDLAERIKDRMVSDVVDISDVLVRDSQTGELLPEVAPGYEITDLDDFDTPETDTDTTQPEPEIAESVPIEPEPAEDEDPSIIARYVGTFTDTYMADGCTISGYYELLLYSNNQASMGTKSTSNSCGDSVYSVLHFTDPNQGSHGAGIFTITLREGFDLIGQYDDTSFSCSMQDALFLFLCSGDWVP